MFRCQENVFAVLWVTNSKYIWKKQNVYEEVKVSKSTMNKYIKKIYLNVNSSTKTVSNMKGKLADGKQQES